MPKTFQVSDDIYDIPDDRIVAFLDQYPNAVEVKSYTVGDDIYDIPSDREGAFLEQFPNASLIGEEQEPDDISEALLTESIKEQTGQPNKLKQLLNRILPLSKPDPRYDGNQLPQEPAPEIPDAVQPEQTDQEALFELPDMTKYNLTVNKHEIPEELYAEINQIVPKEQADFFTRAFVQPLASIGAGVYRASGRITNALDQYATYLDDLTGNKIGKSGLFADLTKLYERHSKDAEKLGVPAGHGIATDIARAFYEGTGQFAVDLPAIFALGEFGLPIFSGFMGGGRAIEEGESLVGGIVKGGVEGTALKYTLGLGKYLPLGVSQAYGGAVFGGLTLTEELAKPHGDVDWPNVVAQTMLGVGLSIGGQKMPHKEFIDNIRTHYGKGKKAFADKMAEHDISKKNANRLYDEIEYVEKNKMFTFDKDRAKHDQILLPTERDRRAELDIEFQRPEKTHLTEAKVLDIKQPEKPAEAPKPEAPNVEATKQRSELQKQQNELHKKWKGLDPKSPEAEVIEERIIRMGDEIRELDKIAAEPVEETPERNVPRDEPHLTPDKVKDAGTKKLLTAGEKATGFETGAVVRIKGIDGLSGRHGWIKSMNSDGTATVRVEGVGNRRIGTENLEVAEAIEHIPEKPTTKPKPKQQATQPPKTQEKPASKPIPVQKTIPEPVTEPTTPAKQAKPEQEPKKPKPKVDEFKQGDMVMYQTKRMKKPRKGMVTAVGKDKDGNVIKYHVEGKYTFEPGELSRPTASVTTQRKAEELKPFSKKDRKKIRADSKEFVELATKEGDLLIGEELATQLHEGAYEGVSGMERISPKAMSITEQNFKNSMADEVARKLGIENPESLVERSQNLQKLKDAIEKARGKKRKAKAELKEKIETAESDEALFKYFEEEGSKLRAEEQTKADMPKTGVTETTPPPEQQQVPKSTQSEMKLSGEAREAPPKPVVQSVKNLPDGYELLPVFQTEVERRRLWQMEKNAEVEWELEQARKAEEKQYLSREHRGPGTVLTREERIVEVEDLKRTLDRYNEILKEPDKLTIPQEQSYREARRHVAGLLKMHKKIETPGAESIALYSEILPGRQLVVAAFKKFKRSMMNRKTQKLYDRTINLQNQLYEKWVQGGRSDKALEKQISDVGEVARDLEALIKKVPNPRQMQKIAEDAGLVKTEISEKDAPRLELPPNVTLKDASKKELLKSTRNRNAKIAKEYNRAHGWQKRLKESELEDIGASIEGVQNLSVRGDTPEAVQKRMTPEMKKVQREYQEAIENSRNEINDYLRGHEKDDYIKFIDNYLAHFYTGGTKKKNAARGRFMKNSPNAKKRKIPTLAEAKELGLTPLTQNVATLHKMWADINWRVATNRQFAYELKHMRDADGRAVVLPSNRAPDDWKLVDSSMLRQIYGTTTTDGKTILHEGKVKVHPEVYPAVRMMTDVRWDNKGVRLVQGINAVGKKFALSFSLFHHASLTESAQAVLARGRNPIRGLVVIGEVDPTTGKRIIATQPHRIGKRLLNDPYFLEEAMLDGLTVGSTSDAHMRTMNRMLLTTEAKLKDYPMGKFVARKVRQFNTAWDKALWDDYHTGLKLFAYYDLKSEMIKRYPEVDVKTLGEGVAKHINNAFGGQEWEAMLRASPKIQQAMTATQLAPDWTISNLKIAGESIAHIKNPMRRRMALRYWRNMIPSLIGSAVGIQYAIYAAYGDPEKGDKPMMFDNEHGREFDIDVTPLYRELPWTDPEDKSRRYIHFGKQAREVLNWAKDPIKTLFTKSSPVVQIAVEQALGVNGPGGFKTDFEQVNIWERFPENIAPELLSRGKAVGEKFVPFSWRGNNFAFAAPMRKGMTNWKAAVSIEKVLDRYANPVIFKGHEHQNYEPALKNLVGDILDAVKLNGLDTNKVMTHGITKARSHYYERLWKALEKNDEKETELAAKAILRLHAGVEQIISSARKRGLEPTDEQYELLERNLTKVVGDLGL